MFFLQPVDDLINIQSQPTPFIFYCNYTFSINVGPKIFHYTSLNIAFKIEFLIGKCIFLWRGILYQNRMQLFRIKRSNGGDFEINDFVQMYRIITLPTYDNPAYELMNIVYAPCKRYLENNLPLIIEKKCKITCIDKNTHQGYFGRYRNGSVLTIFDKNEHLINIYH